MTSAYFNTLSTAVVCALVGAFVIAAGCQRSDSSSSAPLESTSLSENSSAEDQIHEKEQRDALLGQHKEQARFLQQTLRYNKQLCENLYQLRLNCPLLSFLIQRKDALVQCQQGKQEPSWVGLEAQLSSGGALPGTWKLEFTAKQEVFKADIAAQGQRTLFDRLEHLSREDGARSSSARLLDITRVRLVAPQGFKPSSSQPAQELCLRLTVNGKPLSDAQQGGICDALSSGWKGGVDAPVAAEWKWEELREASRSRSECKPDLGEQVKAAHSVEEGS